MNQSHEGLIDAIGKMISRGERLEQSKHILVQLTNEFFEAQDWSKVHSFKKIAHIAIQTGDKDFAQNLLELSLSHIKPVFVEEAVDRGKLEFEDADLWSDFALDWVILADDRKNVSGIYATCCLLSNWIGGDSFLIAKNAAYEFWIFAWLDSIQPLEKSYEFAKPFILNETASRTQIQRNELAEVLFKACIPIRTKDPAFCGTVLQQISGMIDESFNSYGEFFEFYSRSLMEDATHSASRGNALEALERYDQALEIAKKSNDSKLVNEVQVEASYFRSALSGDFALSGKSSETSDDLVLNACTFEQLGMMHHRATEGNQNEDDQQKQLAIYFDSGEKLIKQGNIRDGYVILLFAIQKAIAVRDQLSCEIIYQILMENSFNAPKEFVGTLNALIKIAAIRGTICLPEVDPSCGIETDNFLDDEVLNHNAHLFCLKWRLISANLGESTEEKKELLDELLESAISLTRNKFFQAPESLALSLSSIDGVIDSMVNYIVSIAGGEGKGEFSTKVSKKTSPKLYESLAKSYLFFFNCREWILREYRANLSSGGFNILPATKTIEFRSSSEELSCQLNDELLDYSKLNLEMFMSLARKLKTIRGMATFQKLGRKPIVDNTEILPVGTASFFFIPQDSVCLFLSFNLQEITITVSESRLKTYEKIQKVQDKFCSGLISQKEFASEIENRWPKKTILPTDSFQFVNNFSSLTAPIAAMENNSGGKPMGSYVFSGTNSRLKEKTEDKTKAISFWAPFGAGDADLVLDKATGKVRAKGAQSSLIWGAEYDHDEYATFARQIQKIGRPLRPLPMSVFEQWDLMQLAEKKQLFLDVSNDTSATRSSFLEKDFSNTDCIHISTHGLSFANKSDFSHLVFHESQEANRLHFLEIQSLDLENVQLVFLNCCMSGQGERNAPSELRSLAWAFRAAGASSVIATNWPVDDWASQAFAKEFYKLWLGQNNNIRLAFHEAVKAFSRMPRFSSPYFWGAYCLID